MEKKKKKVLYDHYSRLGLPSGEEGTKLDKIAIRKAYRAKALQLHPDKRPNDPDANAKFQRLQSSYATLMDPQARKQFDSILITLLNRRQQQPNSAEPQQEESSKPKRPSAPNGVVIRVEHIDDSNLFLVGIVIFILAPAVFPAARSEWSWILRWLGYHGGYELLSRRQKLEIRWMIAQAVHYFKCNPNPPQAATNQKSHGHGHEDIEVIYRAFFIYVSLVRCLCFSIGSNLNFCFRFLL
jgi:curved DNA-binding protein CbpA